MTEKNTIIQSINKSIPCISLIGMPGAGKTTIGKRLAYKLHWPFVDSDHLIEATFGRRLQDVVDGTDSAGFLALESKILCSLRVQRCIICTGGSVVYSADAMNHLKKLGTIIHLDVPLSVVQERIAANPERGIVFAPNQTIEDLYEEREQLYQKWADIWCNNAKITPEECVEQIYAKIQPLYQKYLS